MGNGEGSAAGSVDRQADTRADGHAGTLAFRAARDLLLQHRDDCDAARAGFEWPVLDAFNWALDWFDVHARGNATPALWIVEEDGSEQRLSYQELSERSSQVANFLREQGVRRGDRVLLMLPNRVELWETMLAAMKLGAVTIPATMLLGADDLEDRLERGQVAALVVEAGVRDRFTDLGTDLIRISVDKASASVARADDDSWVPFEAAYGHSPDFEPQGQTLATDPVLLYFTSGTTSRPKLVVHTHQSYPVGTLSTMYWLGLRPGDVHWNISSPGWAKHAWSCFFAPFNAGATVFMLNQARFDAKGVLQQLVSSKVTSLCAPPTVWRMLIQQDLKSFPVQLQSVCGAGEPLNPEIIERVREAWDLSIRDGYGQTETTALIANTPGQRIKPGSMGRPLPGFQVVLLDADDQPAQEGEVAIVLNPRPTGLMPGYADDSGRTADVMRGGHYRLGDTATVDADGYYTYVGRADDVFKASDYRISPFELESVLIEHPAVAEAAVIPSPDPMRLAVPKAVVALRDGQVASADLARDILRHCRTRLSPYKRVRRIEFGELPKTISGKIRRVELRARENARTGPEDRIGMEFREEDFDAD